MAVSLRKWAYQLGDHVDVVVGEVPVILDAMVSSRPYTSREWGTVLDVYDGLHNYPANPLAIVPRDE